MLYVSWIDFSQHMDSCDDSMVLQWSQRGLDHRNMFSTDLGKPIGNIWMSLKLLKFATAFMTNATVLNCDVVITCCCWISKELLNFSIAECDGTGEPNIEPQVRGLLMSLRCLFVNFCFIPAISPILFSDWVLWMQFLEWVDEGTKCPYCEGHGFTTCDVCEGKAMI